MNSGSRPLCLLAALLSFGCAGPTVMFEVTVPAETPADAQVVVTGDDSAVAEGLVLARTTDDHFSGTVNLSAEKTLTYRLSLKNPDAAELARGWAPAPDRTVVASAKAPVTAEALVQHWDLPADPANPYVTLVVTVPSGTGSVVTVTGTHPVLGAWELPGLSIEPRADGTRAVRFRLPTNTTTEFKLSRGSWSTMERAADGSDVANRTLTVGTEAITVPVTVASWLPTGKSPRVVTGDVQVIPSIASTVSGISARPAIVYLPPGYADAGNTTRYPVLYLHDGQNLMDGTTSYVGEWHVDEVAEQLIRLGQIRPLIIVGVYNTGARLAEYTAVPEGSYPCCSADLYGQYLIQDVKPLIDSSYRTDPAASVTGLGGSSLGGLVSAYLGFGHSDVFGRLAVVSPSVWWGNKDIVTRANALTAKLPLRIWEDIGTGEGDTSLPDARLLRDALLSKGWGLGDDLQYLEAEGAAHNESAWGARFDRILRYLYPPQ